MQVGLALPHSEDKEPFRHDHCAVAECRGVYLSCCHVLCSQGQDPKSSSDVTGWILSLSLSRSLPSLKYLYLRTCVRKISECILRMPGTKTLNAQLSIRLKGLVQLSYIVKVPGVGSQKGEAPLFVERQALEIWVSAQTGADNCQKTSPTDASEPLMGQRSVCL